MQTKYLYTFNENIFPNIIVCFVPYKYVLGNVKIRVSFLLIDIYFRESIKLNEKQHKIIYHQ